MMNYPGANRATADIFGRDYVNGTEESRLDYERRYCDNLGGQWQHRQSYQPWTRQEQVQLRGQAHRLLQHDHNMTYRDRLTLENCGAHALEGYEPKGGWEEGYSVHRDGPNYAGWARVYVQAGRVIPGNWRNAFANQGKDNRAYYDALGRDIVTFGVCFSDAEEEE